MLVKSEAKFFENNEKIVIKFNTKDLDSETFEFIRYLKNLNDSNKVKIKNKRNGYKNDSTKIGYELGSRNFFLLYKDNNKPALQYKIKVRDVCKAWSLKNICMTTEKLGFIIIPKIDWHRRKIEDCYSAIQNGKFNSYLNLKMFDDGILELVIKY